LNRCCEVRGINYGSYGSCVLSDLERHIYRVTSLLHHKTSLLIIPKGYRLFIVVEEGDRLDFVAEYDP